MVPDDNFEEQRRHPRFKVTWKARISRTNKESQVVTISEVSRGGAHFIHDFNFNKGEAILVECRPLIDGKAINIKLIAKVVHNHLLAGNQGVGTGVAFTRVNDAFTRLINEKEGY